MTVPNLSTSVASKEASVSGKTLTMTIITGFGALVEALAIIDLPLTIQPCHLLAATLTTTLTLITSLVYCLVFAVTRVCLLMHCIMQSLV